MKAVILAGGLGTRISEETDSKPKPMIKIGGRPIIWHIMKIYSAHGVNDFVICCGSEAMLADQIWVIDRMRNCNMVEVFSTGGSS